MRARSVRGANQSPWASKSSPRLTCPSAHCDPRRASCIVFCSRDAARAEGEFDTGPAFRSRFSARETTCAGGCARWDSGVQARLDFGVPVTLCNSWSDATTLDRSGSGTFDPLSKPRIVSESVKPPPPTASNHLPDFSSVAQQGAPASGSPIPAAGIDVFYLGQPAQNAASVPARMGINE
jgi:hypothetical protein